MGKRHHRRKAKTDSKLDGKATAYDSSPVNQETTNISTSTLSQQDSEKETGSSRNISTYVSPEHDDLRQREFNVHFQTNAGMQIQMNSCIKSVICNSASGENVSKRQTKESKETGNNPIPLLEDTVNPDDQGLSSASLKDNLSRKKKKKKHKNKSKFSHSLQTDVEDSKQLKEKIDKNNEKEVHEVNDEKLNSSLRNLSKETKSTDFFLEKDQSADAAADTKNKKNKCKHSRKNASETFIGGKKSELLLTERSTDDAAIQSPANEDKEVSRKEFDKCGKEMCTEKSMRATNKFPKKKKCRKSNGISDVSKSEMEDSVEKEREIDGIESKAHVSNGDITKVVAERSDDHAVATASETKSFVEPKCDTSAQSMELTEPANIPEHMQISIVADPESMQCSNNASSTGSVTADKPIKEERVDCENATVSCDGNATKENISNHQTSALRSYNAATDRNVLNAVDAKKRENAAANLTERPTSSSIAQVQPRPDEETDPVIQRDPTEFPNHEYAGAELLIESKCSEIDKMKSGNDIDKASISCLNLSSGLSREEVNVRDENLINDNGTNL